MKKSAVIGSSMISAIAGVRELAKLELVETLKEEMQVYFDTYPNLDVVGVLAWTPLWNDGEECVRRVSIHIEDMEGYIERRFADNEDTCYDLFTAYGRNEDLSKYDPEMVSLLKANTKLHSREEMKLRDEFVGRPSLKSVLCDVFDTNFWMTIKRTDEGIVITHGEHDCGY